jgi:hypothetical protein
MSLLDWETIFSKQWSVIGKRKRADPPFPSWGGQAIPEEARDERVGQPPRERREESFMPVEITGGWVRVEKGIGGRIVLGVVCAGVLRFSG